MRAVIPTVGVEEEFLVVDPTDGAPVARNETVAAAARERGLQLQMELSPCQIETTSSVASSIADLRTELRSLRRIAAACARDCDAQLLAVAVPPAASHGYAITDTVRYRRIAENYGMLAHEQGICGCHVHVAVPDRYSAIQVGNWLRPWLPTLLALTANSAMYHGRDTGYASWRTILWRRWPSAGPPPYFASVTEFETMLDMMRTAGTILDDAMVYWDVRPSATYPTVEVRVSDVPAAVEDTVLLATIVRAAVMTALDDIAAGSPIPAVSADTLRAGYWKAAHDGLAGNSLDVCTGRLLPAHSHLAQLLDRVRPALRATGDDGYADQALLAIRNRGNGAIRQRNAYLAHHDILDVLAESSCATIE